ncbi:hypothetical protein ASPNIDRAFT_43258 [Aspergillus niger ATCC 1015]|uniref:Uncharacterized protein n=1 Tax=Aspergillus niger (strain ATCC 1015 / CBS 113.46 / FGSC A1144 / LSHB Ac4 / NCTC 3858a / NRRL 328 / USDA 3528.7) TaxID=380704 RepID=G3XMX0_ASPNA|nr:hypothetical protein ASPNIDRAFT_43258 [Aspergillus niger ATCC 1015]
MDSDGVITNFQCLCCASRYSFLCCLNECSLETPAFHRLPSHGNLRKHHLSHHAFSDVSPASIPSFVICEDRWSEFFSKWTRADQPSGHSTLFCASSDLRWSLGQSAVANDALLVSHRTLFRISSGEITFRSCGLRLTSDLAWPVMLHTLASRNKRYGLFTNLGSSHDPA